jgi:hypothetical protein
MFATAGAMLALGSSATGFAIGWLLALIFEWRLKAFRGQSP